jgi:hypothetical protein
VLRAGAHQALESGQGKVDGVAVPGPDQGVFAPGFVVRDDFHQFVRGVSVGHAPVEVAAPEFGGIVHFLGERDAAGKRHVLIVRGILDAGDRQGGARGGLVGGRFEFAHLPAEDGEVVLDLLQPALRSLGLVGLLPAGLIEPIGVDLSAA